MTLDQAVEKLQGLTHLEWHIVEGRFIRGRNPLSRRVFCPVTALAFAMIGEEHHTFAFYTVGRAIGLSNEDVAALAAAADHMSGAQIGLRQRLLEALSLEEGMP